MILEWTKCLRLTHSHKTGYAYFRQQLVKLIYDEDGWLELPIEVDEAIQSAQLSNILEVNIYQNNFLSIQLEDVQDEKIGEMRVVKIIPAGREEYPDWHVRVKRSEFIRMKNGNS